MGTSHVNVYSYIHQTKPHTTPNIYTQKTHLTYLFTKLHCINPAASRMFFTQLIIYIFCIYVAHKMHSQRSRKDIAFLVAFQSSRWGHDVVCEREIVMPLLWIRFNKLYVNIARFFKSIVTLARRISRDRFENVMCCMYSTEDRYTILIWFVAIFYVQL